MGDITVLQNACTYLPGQQSHFHRWSMAGSSGSDYGKKEQLNSRWHRKEIDRRAVSIDLST